MTLWGAVAGGYGVINGPPRVGCGFAGSDVLTRARGAGGGGGAGGGAVGGATPTWDGRVDGGPDG